jgi:hypothetical protein
MMLNILKKTPIIINRKYTLFYFLVVILTQIYQVNAASDVKMVELSSLGSFETKFSAVKKVALMKGQSLIGEVAYMPGKNFSVTFPFDVQQVSYLVTNGSLVNQGDKIALVEGYDVHHFIDNYESSKTLLAIQKKHFQTNKQYFENKTLKSSQWIEITKSYYEAKLNFEHLRHLMSFLHIDKNEQISLISPKKGIIQIPKLMTSKLSGGLAFDVLSPEDIKVKVTSPLLLSSNLSHLEISPTCTLSVKYIERIADKFHQRLWTEPTTTNCKLTLGQSIKVTPIQSIDGYTIAKSAIFEFENKNYIAIKVNAALSLVPINLIGTSEEGYIFTTAENIDAKQALISSVSILQGSLLSLGAE